MKKKTRNAMIGGFAVLCIVVLGITLGLTAKSVLDDREILEDSIKSQLMSIAEAAKETIDVDAFLTYNSKADYYEDYPADATESVNESLLTLKTGYKGEIAALRQLADSVGAKYIYALRLFDGVPYFIYDTDVEVLTTFNIYELEEGDDVFNLAFSGVANAGIMNVVDEFGSFHTGAVPIYKEGEVVGVVCADLEDSLVKESIRQFTINMTVMGCVLALVLVLFGVGLFLLMKNIDKMQRMLSRMANFDKLTELPNRRYLLDQLAEMTGKRAKTPFALYFIDMDNFKKVNDHAGHDAGDALLQHVAMYLQTAHKSSKVFRPGAGSLNVAARVGGDEFIIIMPNITTAEEAQIFAKEIIDGFSAEEIDKYIEKYEVGLSIGIALYPENTENFHVLIKYADIAMYHAKRGGKNCYRVYNDEMRNKDEK